MSNRTLGLIIFLIAITAGLIYLAIYPKPPTQVPSVIKTTPTPAPQTSLIITPNLLTVSSSSGSLAVDIDTKQNNITGVQLELSFDPKVITKVKLTPGSFFPNPVKLIDNVDYKNGRITYVLAITPTDNPVAGKGTMATIDFTGDFQLSQTTKIDLLPKTLITAKGAQGSVLKEAVGATINFSQTGAINTASPSNQLR